MTNIEGMFASTACFDGDISNWDVSRVANMAFMFADGKFNGDISKWDTSRVTKMEGMFSGNAVFRSDISRWAVSKVINMRNMFLNAKLFNIDISDWDVSSVQSMDHMFAGAVSFKRKLCGVTWLWGCLGPLKGNQRGYVRRVVWVNFNDSMRQHCFLAMVQNRAQSCR